MFYTNQPIKLHSKCLCILEMLQKSNNYYEKEKSLLYAFDNCKDMYALIKLSYRRIDLVKAMKKYSSISQRLEQYYANTFGAIVERAILRGEQLTQTN